MLTREQIELRRTRIGSSEIGALLGIDPYKSAFDVFLEKALPIEEHREDHRSWGLDVEQAIIAHHIRKEGHTLLPAPGSLTHPTLPLVCTPDALARTNGGHIIAIQAKNDAGHGQIEWGEPGTDDAPLLYVAQATVEIGVLIGSRHEIQRDELAVAIRGDPPVCFPIPFDADLFGELAETAARFVRDHILTGKPPPATPPERAEYIKRRWSKDDGSLIEATPEIVAKVQKVAWLREQRGALLAELTDAENDLKEAIGDASGVAGLCTYKVQKGSTYQVTKKPCRVLRLAKSEEGRNADAAEAA